MNNYSEANEATPTINIEDPFAAEIKTVDPSTPKKESIIRTLDDASISSNQPLEQRESRTARKVFTPKKRRFILISAFSCIILIVSAISVVPIVLYTVKDYAITAHNNGNLAMGAGEEITSSVRKKVKSTTASPTVSTATSTNQPTLKVDTTQPTPQAPAVQPSPADQQSQAPISISPTAPTAPTVAQQPMLTSFNASFGVYNLGTNLTNEGPIDWVHWGLKTAIDVNRANSASQWISNATWTGNTYRDHIQQSINFSWQNGTPLSIIAAASGTCVGNTVGTGVSFSVNSDTNVHTLQVYVGAYLALGTLTVSFNGQDVYTGSFDKSRDLLHPSDNARAVITYSSNIPAQITISYTLTKATGGNSHLLLEAAALQ